MKTKVVVLLMAITFSISGIVAQNRQQANPEDMAKSQSETLTEKLKLNDEQKEKVYEVTLKYAKERATSMSSETDREKRRAAFQESQKKQDEELKALFTEEQQKEYEKYRKEMQDRRGSGNRDGNSRSR